MSLVSESVTDEQAPPPEKEDAVPASAPDSTLEHLVHLATAVDRFQPRVTLVVSGTVIHGEIVAGRAWFEGVIRKGNEDGGPGNMETLEIAFREELDFYSQPPAEDPTYGFLHLRDAVMPLGPLPVHIGWMRLRLSEISGWSIGRPQAQG
jgi:hypothetical protein